MNHPKDDSLFGLGLPGDCELKMQKHGSNPNILTGKNLKDDVWNTTFTFWASATYC